MDRLITEIADKNAVSIDLREIRGGTNTRRTMRQIRAADPVGSQKHFVLIYDCGGDDAVKTRMRDEYDNLAKAGYSKIVCMRDVRPKYTRAGIQELEAGLPVYVKTKPIVVDFILSIMEIEAWFLAEHTHFARIDPALTVAAIAAALGFNPEQDDMQLRTAPCDDISKCYALAGKAYVKGNARITVDALDCTCIYAGLVDKIPYLKKLCRIIESFLTTR
ncbi:MAG: hypothetical protein ABSH20_14475 [Tepidisphaeraceae bacterium]